MKLRNIQNGAVVKVISEDKVRKVVQVEFEADGKTRDFSLSTIKRWWREIKDDEPQLVQMPGTEGNWGEKHWGEVEEDKAGDGTSYKQVMQEIIQDEKKAIKKVKATKSKKTEAPKFDSEALRNHIEKTVSKWKDVTIVERKKKDGSSMNKFVFKVGGHAFGTMTFSRNNITINIKSGVSTTEPTKHVSAFFDYRYIYTEDTPKFRDVIISLLTSAYEKQVVKNNMKKESKKEDK